MKSVYKEAKQEWPARLIDPKQEKELIVELLRQQQTQQQIADVFGVTQSYISQIIRLLDLPKGVKNVDKRRGASEEYQSVVDYIKTNGGTVNNALRKLGLRIHPATIKTYADKIGFDYRKYKLAYQRYGEWEILPCIPEKIYTNDYLVDAKCHLCGKVYQVTLVNLRCGSSANCFECSKSKPRKGIQVICEQSGEIFRSIRSQHTTDSGCFLQCSEVSDVCIAEQLLLDQQVTLTLLVDKSVLKVITSHGSI